MLARSVSLADFGQCGGVGTQVAHRFGGAGLTICLTSKAAHG